MRTTITLDDELLKQAKRTAVETGQTLSAVIEDALRERLARQGSATPRRPISLPPGMPGKLMPGVDLDNNAALRDLMDKDDLPYGPFHG